MYAKGEYVRAFHEVIKIAPVTLPKLNLGDLDVAPAAGLGEYLPWCNVNRSFGRNGLPQWPRLSRRQCVQATRRSAVPLVLEFIRLNKITIRRIFLHDQVLPPDQAAPLWQAALVEVAGAFQLGGEPEARLAKIMDFGCFALGCGDHLPYVG